MILDNGGRGYDNSTNFEGSEGTCLQFIGAVLVHVGNTKLNVLIW